MQGDGRSGRDARQKGPGAGRGLRHVERQAGRDGEGGGLALGEPFSHTLRVRYNECDPQGVVFNANYLTYIDLAMTELWRELGGYQAMVDAGVDMVVAEVRIRYRAPLRFDDEFEVHATVANLDEDSMTTALVLVRDGERVSEGEIRHAFIESGGGPKAPIPESIRERLEKYAAS